MAKSADTSGAPRRNRVRNLTLREQVREYLREEILSNRLEPGTELNELALSRSLEVSRGPLREALGQLASEGLVKIIPRRGATVSELTAAEFVDAYQVREALETMAIRLAVGRIGPDQVERLKELHQTMVAQAERGEVTAFFETNAAFHQVLVDSSGNKRLRDMYRLLMGEMGRYQARSLARRGGLGKSVSEHSKILEAVVAGDAERAATLLADHIEIPQRLEEEAAEHRAAVDKENLSEGEASER